MNEIAYVLIDGDYLLYKVGFGSQKTIYRVYEDQNEEDGYLQEFRYKRELDNWIDGNEDWSWGKKIVADSWGICKYNTDLCIKRIMRDSRAKSCIIFFTDTYNFREKVATLLPYKGNRDSSHKPVHFSRIKDYIIESYGCRVVYGCEADDALSIYQQSVPEIGTTIIYTPDKDLDMVPGWRINKKNEVIWIDEESARESFYMQLLMGDATDNIPGIYKLTGTKATAPLKREVGNSYPNEYECVREMYLKSEKVKEGDVDGILLEIGTLLYMKRDYEDKIDMRDFWKSVERQRTEEVK